MRVRLYFLLFWLRPTFCNEASQLQLDCTGKNNPSGGDFYKYAYGSCWGMELAQSKSFTDAQTACRVINDNGYLATPIVWTQIHFVIDNLMKATNTEQAFIGLKQDPDTPTSISNWKWLTGGSPRDAPSVPWNPGEPDNTPGDGLETCGRIWNQATKGASDGACDALNKYICMYPNPAPRACFSLKKANHRNNAAALVQAGDKGIVANREACAQACFSYALCFSFSFNRDTKDCKLYQDDFQWTSYQPEAHPSYDIFVQEEDDTLCNNGYVSDCLPENPCITKDSGAQCVDAVDSFTCTCSTGFTGTLCENEKPKLDNLPKTQLEIDCNSLSAQHKYIYGACYVFRTGDQTFDAWTARCAHFSHARPASVLTYTHMSFLSDMIGAAGADKAWTSLFQANKNIEPAGNWMFQMGDSMESGELAPWDDFNGEPGDAAGIEDCSQLNQYQQLGDYNCAETAPVLCMYDDESARACYSVAPNGANKKSHSGTIVKDMGTMSGTDPEIKCAEFCQKEKRCFAFSFNPSTKHCILSQDDTGWTVQQPASASGYYIYLEQTGSAYCDILVDVCTGNPCDTVDTGATCTLLSVGFRCECSSGYTGELCKEEAADPCVSNPCTSKDSGATCTVNSGAFICTCSASYGGARCTFDNSTAETLDDFSKATNFTDPDKGPVEKSSAITDALPFVVRDLDPEVLKNLSWGWSDIMAYCSFNGQRCDLPNDIVQFFEPNMGNCFTFNHENVYKKYNYKLRQAGMRHGLEFVLRAGQNDYLPWTTMAGNKLFIHNQSETVYAESIGFGATPGFVTTVGLRYTVYQRLSKPYGNCIENKKKLKYYYYPEEYSTEGCYRTCYQNEVYKKCGCMDPRYPSDPDTLVCGLNQRKCLNDFLTNSGNPDAWDCSELDDCPPRCLEGYYAATVSRTTFPDIPFTCRHLTGERQKNCTRNMFGDVMKVEIYFEDLNYLKYEETKRYELFNFLSDVGGQLGILCGMSVISITELCWLLGKLGVFWISTE